MLYRYFAKKQGFYFEYFDSTHNRNKSIYFTQFAMRYPVQCTYCQIDGEDFVNFSGLLRKREL